MNLIQSRISDVRQTEMRRVACGPACRLILGLAVLCGVMGTACHAWPEEQQDGALQAGPGSASDIKPLPPLSTPHAADPGSAPPPVLQGWAKKSLETPVTGAGDGATSTGSRVLSGRVQTLRQAALFEKDRVDWYTWYLNAREYLRRTGGLACSPGTLIRFYKSGEIRPMTQDADCLTSIGGRRFPLPASTRLQVLVLPVRPTELPPAPPADIQNRVRTAF